eukprot:972794_1
MVVHQASTLRKKLAVSRRVWCLFREAPTIKNQDTCLDWYCYRCHNNDAYMDEREISISTALSRDSTAFRPKVKLTGSRSKHQRGCHCKRSACLKRYCECFQAGVGCSSICKCVGCQNEKSPVASLANFGKTQIHKIRIKSDPDGVPVQIFASRLQSDLGEINEMIRPLAAVPLDMRETSPTPPASSNSECDPLATVDALATALNHACTSGHDDQSHGSTTDPGVVNHVCASVQGAVKHLIASSSSEVKNGCIGIPTDLSLTQKNYTVPTVDFGLNHADSTGQSKLNRATITTHVDPRHVAQTDLNGTLSDAKASPNLGYISDKNHAILAPSSDSVSDSSTCSKAIDDVEMQDVSEGSQTGSDVIEMVDSPESPCEYSAANSCKVEPLVASVLDASKGPIFNSPLVLKTVSNRSASTVNHAPASVSELDLNHAPGSPVGMSVSEPQTPPNSIGSKDSESEVMEIIVNNNYSKKRPLPVDPLSGPPVKFMKTLPFPKLLRSVKSPTAGNIQPIANSPKSPNSPRVPPRLRLMSLKDALNRLESPSACQSGPAGKSRPFFSQCGSLTSQSGSTMSQPQSLMGQSVSLLGHQSGSTVDHQRRVFVIGKTGSSLRNSVAPVSDTTPSTGLSTVRPMSELGRRKCATYLGSKQMQTIKSSINGQILFMLTMPMWVQYAAETIIMAVIIKLRLVQKKKKKKK